MIETIKQKVNLLQYIEQATGQKGKRVGQTTYGFAPCPMCNDGNNHFRVNTSGNYYNSFNGCCKGGSIIDFLMEYEHLEKNSAIAKAKELTGIEEHSYQKNQISKDTSKESPPPTVSEQTMVNKTDFTDIIVKFSSNRTDYYKKRGLSDKIITQYKLGYSEQGFNHAIQLANKPNQKPLLQEKINPKFSYYRYFLPVWDQDGKCRYFITRLDEDSLPLGATTTYKTHNPKGYDVRLFNDRYLYNPFLIEKAVFIVEGIFDALSLEEIGQQALALNSVMNTKRVLDTIKVNVDKFKDKVLIVSPDNDQAGQKLIELAAEIKSLGLLCEVYPIPDQYKDINEFLINDRSFFNRHVEQFLHKAFNKDLVANYLEQYAKELIENRDKTALQTGFNDLDEILGGGLYTGLYVLGAISSLGKTTYVLQIADHIALQGYDVLFFSLEMSKFEVVSKSLSRETFLLDSNKASSTREIMNGEFDQNTLVQAVESYTATANHLSIIEGGFDTDILKIQQKVEQHIRLHGTKPVVIVDYLQILNPIDIRMTDKQSNDKNVTELKKLSRDMDIPIIAISSFNRENYNTTVSFKAFKETGAIEYTADVVIGLQLKGIEGKDEKEINELKAKSPRNIELVVLKNRNGQAYSKSDYKFYSKFNYFESL